MRTVPAISILTALVLCASSVLRASSASAQTANTPSQDTPPPSKFFSAEDGWLDVSGFLDEKFGFLPVVIPITEPAVGYGAAGALAFLSKPLGEAKAGFGRPDIAIVGGLGTENGSWGVLIGDVRHWFDDRLETQVGFTHLSANLDFHGIGQDTRLDEHPLRYNLEPTGGVLRAKYRLGESAAWAGLGYVFAATRVTFEAPAGAPGLPDFRRDSKVGGLTPSFTYDSRDNLFTPLRGSFLEAVVGIFSPALGGGAPIMRYQGDEVAQIEVELRWQFWKRFSLVVFGGGGVAWNDLERFNNVQKVPTGGFGFRYEIARRYGIQMGLDIAFGPDNTAVYVQVGSAWARP